MALFDDCSTQAVLSKVMFCLAVTAKKENSNSFPPHTGDTIVDSIVHTLPWQSTTSGQARRRQGVAPHLQCSS